VAGAFTYLRDTRESLDKLLSEKRSWLVASCVVPAPTFLPARLKISVVLRGESVTYIVLSGSLAVRSRQISRTPAIK
jgi:hypothetical protein